MKNRKHKRSKRAFRKSILIICDGSTEKHYIESMKKEVNTQNHSIRIEPKLGHSDAFEKVFEDIEDIMHTPKDELPYDLIFYVRDMDACYRQNKITDYNKLKKRLLSKPEAKKRLFFIESRPCIEFWFLLHFIKTDRLFNSCSEAEKQLLSYLTKYKKNEQCARAVYNDLRPHLEMALDNADEINSKKRQQREQYSYSKINELYQKLCAL